MSSVLEYTIPSLREEFERMRMQAMYRVMTTEEFIKLNAEHFWLTHLREDTLSSLIKKFVNAIVNNERIKPSSAAEVYDLARSMWYDGVLSPIIMTVCGDHYVIIDGNVRTEILKEFHASNHDVKVPVIIMPYCFDKNKPIEYARAILMTYMMHAISTRVVPSFFTNENIIRVVTDGLIAYTYGHMKTTGKDSLLIESLINMNTSKLINILTPLADEIGLPHMIIEDFISALKASKDARDQIVQALQNNAYITPQVTQLIRQAAKQKEKQEILNQVETPPPTPPVSVVPPPPPPSVSLPKPVVANPPQQLNETPKSALSASIEEENEEIRKEITPTPPTPSTRGRTTTVGEVAAEAFKGKKVPQDIAEHLLLIPYAEVRDSAMEAAADRHWTKDDAIMLVALFGFMKKHRIKCISETGETIVCGDNVIFDRLMKAVEHISQYRDTVNNARDAMLKCANDDCELYTGDVNFRYKLYDIKRYALAYDLPPHYVETAFSFIAKLLLDLFQDGRVDLIRELVETAQARAWEKLVPLFRDIANALSPVPPEK